MRILRLVPIQESRGKSEKEGRLSVGRIFIHVYFRYSSIGFPPVDCSLQSALIKYDTFILTQPQKN